MYGLFNKHDTPIAYHERKRVLRDFSYQVPDDELYIKKVKKSTDVSNLYLIRFGSGWIPSILYDDADILTEEECMNYDQVADTIKKELLLSDLSSSEKKILKKAYIYFKGKTDDIRKNSTPDVKSIKKFKELKDQYNSCIDKDDTYYDL